MTTAAPAAAPLTLRPITPADELAMAEVIRTVMPEFGAKGPGFAIMDPEVDHMARAYDRPRAAYWVVLDGERVVGGGGVAPLEHGEPDVCELRKMYFLPEVRGRGAGRQLIEQALSAARGFGFGRCYLETLTGMDAAQALYQKLGFRRIEARMGDTGHFGCNRYYLIDL